MDNNKRGYQTNEGGSLVMLLTGFVFGMAAIALYDDNLRNRLKRRYQNIKEEGQEKLEEAKENLEEGVEKGKRKIAKKLQNGQSRVARTM